MLNELRDLALCLEKTGIKTEDLHPNFIECPKYPACQVYLNEQGSIFAIELVHPTQIRGIRKWKKANGVSFPAFNMPPLFKIDCEKTQEQIKKIKKLIEKGKPIPIDELLSIIDSSETLWNKNALKKLEDCLKKPLADISEYLDTVPEAFVSIEQLISRARLIQADQFKLQLIDEFKRSLKEGTTENVIDFLFFYSGKKPNNFQIILELYDRNHFEYPANHRNVQRWMNDQFLKSTAKEKTSDLDAFGSDASGKYTKFPSVGFKNALGNVILRAMNHEYPCQTRYGMINYHSFPAGEEIRQKMKSSLEWLAGEERKGKTWCDLSRRLKKPMLLFAYPSFLPKDLPDLAGMMGDVEDDGEETREDRFALIAEKVTSSLRGILKESTDSDINVFVLVKMDKARTKVLLNNHFSAEHVIQSARLWQEGCRNTPMVEIRCFGKNKGDKPFWRQPLVPFPGEVVWCLNTVWTHQGRCAEVTHSFTIDDTLTLLLRHGLELNRVANRALNSILRHSVSLLTALGQAHAQGLVHEIDKKHKKYSKQPLLLPSILGLLLHKLNLKEGDIMTSPVFLVGRIFSLADGLHLEYCRHVRNNSVPQQLLGNSLMSSALDAPERALSTMAQRILPYQAWAQTAKGEEGGLARFFLKNIGEVSEQLKEVALPKQTNDSDKAQMLLGYLARRKQD